MRRRVFNLLAVVSLLLAVVCVTLWVVEDDDAPLDGISTKLAEGWYVSSFSAKLSLHNDPFPYNGGTFSLADGPGGPPAPPAPTVSGITLPFIYYRHITYPNGGVWWTLTLSSPFLVGLFAILPAAWLLLCWRRRRHRLAIAGKVCVRCGYDLRASSGQCPECGQPIPADSAVAAKQR